MASDIIVLKKEDFDQFEQELIDEIKEIFDKNIRKTKWLRS